jgi:hypothetical protein
VFEGQVEEKKRGISSKQSIFPFLFVIRMLAKSEKSLRLFVFLGSLRPHLHSGFLGPLLAKPPEH